MSFRREVATKGYLFLLKSLLNLLIFWRNNPSMQMLNYSRFKVDGNLNSDDEGYCDDLRASVTTIEDLEAEEGSRSWGEEAQRDVKVNREGEEVKTSSADNKGTKTSSEINWAHGSLGRRFSNFGYSRRCRALTSSGDEQHAVMESLTEGVVLVWVYCSSSSSSPYLYLYSSPADNYLNYMMMF